MRKEVVPPKATWEELFNDLKPVGTAVMKNTTDNTLCCNGLKLQYLQGPPLLKKLHVQAHIKFAIEHLNDSEKV